MTPHPSLLTRKIIHVDMDAFYASVETKLNPSLKGKPVIVGWPGARSVVTTASYEARKFGVKSAMPMLRAMKLCPHAEIVRPNFSAYKAEASKIREILFNASPIVEPLSLDEAFLDVTEVSKNTRAIAIAQGLKAAIKEATGLTASAGVAPNKMLAKIASDLQKPDGLSFILPDQVAAFMQKLPLGKIHGIGKVTQQKLESSGLRLCGDVLDRGENWIADRFNLRFARWLYQRAQGIDENPVCHDSERKSLGHEQTYGEDITKLDTLVRETMLLVDEAVSDLKQHGLLAKTITLKLKSPAFRITNRSSSFPFAHALPYLFRSCMMDLIQRQADSLLPVRLIGISFHQLMNAESQEKNYFQPLLLEE